MKNTLSLLAVLLLTNLLFAQIPYGILQPNDIAQPQGIKLTKSFSSCALCTPTINGQDPEEASILLPEHFGRLIISADIFTPGICETRGPDCLPETPCKTDGQIYVINDSYIRIGDQPIHPPGGIFTISVKKSIPCGEDNLVPIYDADDRIIGHLQYKYALCDKTPQWN